jgi:hypothetical protein
MSSAFLRVLATAVAVAASVNNEHVRTSYVQDRSRIEKIERIAALRRRIEAVKHQARLSNVYNSSRFNMFVGNDLLEAEQKLGRYEIDNDAWDSDFTSALRRVESAERNMPFYFRNELRVSAW